MQIPRPPLADARRSRNLLRPLAAFPFLPFPPSLSHFAEVDAGTKEKASPSLGCGDGGGGKTIYAKVSETSLPLPLPHRAVGLATHVKGGGGRRGRKGLSPLERSSPCFPSKFKSSLAISISVKTDGFRLGGWVIALPIHNCMHSPK